MKKYEGKLTPGMKILYNGFPIRWANKKGNVCEVMNPGKYVISRMCGHYVLVKSARKNAVTEHYIEMEDIESGLKELEFADVTCTMGLICMNLSRPRWVLMDDKYDETIKKAKEYNKR